MFTHKGIFMCLFYICVYVCFFVSICPPAAAGIDLHMVNEQG